MSAFPMVSHIVVGLPETYGDTVPLSLCTVDQVINIFAFFCLIYSILFLISFDTPCTIHYTATKILFQVISHLQELKECIIPELLEHIINITYKNKTWKRKILQWGKQLFDPLLILYVCPLTKKLSGYDFNGRFIWTVRDRITTKKL